MVDQYGVSSIIAQDVFRKARECNISYEDLLNLDLLIRGDFIERNVSHIPIPLTISEVDDHFHCALTIAKRCMTEA